MRLVLDGNVIVAGLISPKGPPARLLRAWIVGRFDLMTAREQLDELGRGFDYDRLRNRVAHVQRQAFVDNVEVLAVMATDLPIVAYSPDPSDNIILAIAIAGRAEFIVSGDKSDVLALRKVAGIPIVNPREAIEHLGLTVE